MRRFACVLSAIAVFSGLALFSAFAVAESLPGPKIVVTPPNVDLGSVSDDVKSKATFTIKNAGKADLIIYDVKTTCGCTVANLSSKKIAPGETAMLDAYYDSHNGNGQVHRFVNVHCNDRTTEYVSLGITANVIPKPAPDLTLSAYNVTGLLLAPGGKDTRTINIASSGQQDLVIQEVTASSGVTAELGDVKINPAQTAKVGVTLKTGNTSDLRIVTSPKIASGGFQEVVTIRSNSKRKPVVSIVIQGTIQ